MSTFDGLIEEIPGISVDNFLHLNLKSTIFFLSHYHSDHIKGLIRDEFRNIIKNENVFLYASPITIRIIIERNPYIKFNFKELKQFEPRIIKIPNTNEYLEVTAIPAGHCMGSIMILFETRLKRILYTGDFRIDPRDFKKMPPLLIENKPKVIDNIYLDTTFFSKKFDFFPKRKYVIDKVTNEIDIWLKDDPLNRIHLITPAYYAYEFVFQEIWNILKEKIYIQNNNLYNLYRYVPEMDNIFTQNYYKSRIEFYCNESQTNIITEHIKIIRLSAFKWRDNETNKFYSKDCENYFSICYATHASYSEIRQILEDFKPKKITPCVVPIDEDKKQELMSLLKEILDSFEEMNVKRPEPNLKFKLNHDYTFRNLDSDNDSLPDSPPSKHCK